ncbi:MAG TPA: phospho-N-acetylmuramoyl-pentapeptide-transferase, partial [Pirellulales bacterium]|nr:phospho-N-acetylmuramoyl-pentapeptide-transferase [Pirellulales bacterium]
GWLVHARQTPLAIETWLPISAARTPGLLTAWAALVILSSSNAVNLADGLDGLAGGSVVIATACLALIAWLTTNFTPQAMGLYVLAAGMLGSMLGFLRFNRHPARVFMGDTGSLPLGALLGMLALAIGHELLWVVIGGVFVAEAVSVMLQVGWYKWRKERLFRCAPLHHHFQFLGWPEHKIVARFWLASLVCAVAALTLVKFSLRAEPTLDAQRSAAAMTASRTR